jgi:hypothetical protein
MKRERKEIAEYGGNVFPAASFDQIAEPAGVALVAVLVVRSEIKVPG